MRGGNPSPRAQLASSEEHTRGPRSLPLSPEFSPMTPDLSNLTHIKFSDQSDPRSLQVVRVSEPIAGAALLNHRTISRPTTGWRKRRRRHLPPCRPALRAVRLAPCAVAVLPEGKAPSERQTAASRPDRWRPAPSPTPRTPTRSRVDPPFLERRVMADGETHRETVQQDAPRAA